MAKGKDIEITGSDMPWEGIAKKRVEEYIKKVLASLTAKKIGCHHSVTNDADKTVTMLGFADDDARGAWIEDPEGNASLVLSSITFSAGGASEERYMLSTRLTSPLKTTVVKGGSNPVTFSYRSLWGGNADDHDQTPGTATVTVNGTEIPQLRTSLTSGQSYTLDVGPWLTEETNSVTLTVANAHGSSRQFSTTVRTVSLDVGFDNFDQSVPRDAAWQLRVIATGAEALVHVAVDGIETATATVTNSTREITVDPQGLLLPGVHTLSVWGENAEYGLATSPVEAQFIKKGAEAIAFASGIASTVKLYDTVRLPYFMLRPDKAGQTVEVTFSVIMADGASVTAPGTQSVTLDAQGASGIVEASWAVEDADTIKGSPLTLTVTCGAVSASVTLTVESSGTLLEPAGECKVELLARGRSNADADAREWKSFYEGEETCRVTLSDGFILGNGAGFDGDAFVIPAGKRATLSGFLPFGADFSANGNRQGRTIELELELRDCTDSSAVAVTCTDNGTGFTVGASEVALSCGQSVVTPVTPGRRVRVGFVIEGSTRHCVNKLVDGTTERDANVAYLYVNGVVCRVMDYASASWKQPSPRNIVIGCDSADVALYAVRIYDKALTTTQMLGNHAYDTPGAEAKQELARRNDILDSQGGVDFTKTLTALPSTPYKIWDMERMPKGKTDEVSTTTEFVNPVWEESARQQGQDVSLACASFVCRNHPMVLDGTSSLFYPDPYKNFGSKYGSNKGGWTVKIEGIPPVTIHSYSITPGIEDGETEMVDKVNFASSEGLFNIITAHLYHQALLGVSDAYPGVLSPAQARQKADGGIGAVTFRQSLSGFPMTGWLRQGDGKAPRFLSIYNVVNNKYQGSYLGIQPGEEIWEVDDNVTYFDEYLGEGHWDASLKEDNWQCRATTLYYARVPKKGKDGADYGTAKDASGVAQANAENAKIRRFHNWMYSCNPNIAERYRLAHGVYEPLPSPVTYGSATYDRDTPEYRLAKFNAEHADYLDKASAMLYFLVFVHILGIDSMAKNMSIRFIERDGKWIAQFVQRDSDTGFGYNNRGQFGFRPWLEWNDGYDPLTGAVAQLREKRDPATGAFSLDPSCGEAVFNGRLSGLWDCVSRAWASDLSEMYALLRNAGLSAQGLLAIYDGFRDQWCEALYNADAMGYVNTGNFDMAHGDKRESFRQFVTMRQAYMDSKYAPASTAPLVLRVWGNPTGLVLRYAQPVYGAVKWGAGAVVSERQVNAGEPVYFPAPPGAMNETTVTIYGADMLTSVGSYTMDSEGNVTESGLEGLSDGNVVVASGLDKCTLLKELVLDYSERPANSQAMQLQGLGDAKGQQGSKALERLIVRNCPGVTGAVQTSSTRLKEVDLRGCANIPSVTLNPTATLEAVRLGSGITQLTLSDMASLSELSLEGYAKLTHIRVTGCPKLKDRMKQLTEAVLKAQESSRCLSYLELDPIAWTGASASLVEGIATIAECRLKGTITLSTNVKPSFSTRCGWIDLFGDTDSADAPLRIVVDPSQRHVLSSVTIQGAAHMSSTGLVTFKAIPKNNMSNAFTKVEWTVEASPSNAARLDVSTKSETAVVNVMRTGSEDDAQPPKFTLKLAVTCSDGSVKEAQREIFCYRPRLKPGYFIYADGSWGPDYNLGIPEKTAVAYCFFVNPQDYTDCRVMALKTFSGYWGPTRDRFNRLGVSYDANSPADRVAGGSPLVGVYGEYFKDKGATDTEGGCIVDTGNPGNGYFRAYADGSSFGYGLPHYSDTVANTGRSTVPSEWADDGLLDGDDVKAMCGQSVPGGLKILLQVIRARNLWLDDSHFPECRRPYSHADSAGNMITEMQDLNTLVAGKNEATQSIYFPVFSLCHAYEPIVPGVTVTRQLSVHRWYLPTAAEVLRIGWYVAYGDSFPAENGGPGNAMKRFINAFPNATFHNIVCCNEAHQGEHSSVLDLASKRIVSSKKFYVLPLRPVAAFDPTLEE